MHDGTFRKLFPPPSSSSSSSSSHTLLSRMFVPTTGGWPPSLPRRALFDSSRRSSGSPLPASLNWSPPPLLEKKRKEKKRELQRIPPLDPSGGRACRECVRARGEGRGGEGGGAVRGAASQPAEVIPKFKKRSSLCAPERAAEPGSPRRAAGIYPPRGRASAAPLFESFDVSLRILYFFSSFWTRLFFLYFFNILYIATF